MSSLYHYYKQRDKYHKWNSSVLLYAPKNTVFLGTMRTTRIAVSVIIADALIGFPMVSTSFVFAGGHAKATSNMASPNTENLPLT